MILFFEYWNQYYLFLNFLSDNFSAWNLFENPVRRQRTHRTNLKGIYCLFIILSYYWIFILFYPDFEFLPPVNSHWECLVLGVSFSQISKLICNFENMAQSPDVILTSNNFTQLVISFFKFSSAKSRVLSSSFSLFSKVNQSHLNPKDNLRNSACCQINMRVKGENWM